MKDHGMVMRGLADAALESTFGAEYIKLDSEGARLVRQDFLDASEEDNVSAQEYRRRIGVNNLAAYAETMKARAKQGW